MMTDEQQDAFSFFSTILTPGSSLNPTFLLVVDGAFAVLLAVLFLSAYLTRGNIHFFALIGIELALWASVKWFISELKKVPVAVTDTVRVTEQKKQQ